MCDIWSFGVIIYLFLCGHPPFIGNTDVEILSKVRKGVYNFDYDYWDNVSEEAKDLISNCLQLDPRLRPSAAQILNHKWFRAECNNDHTIQLVNNSDFLLA